MAQGYYSQCGGSTNLSKRWGGLHFYFLLFGTLRGSGDQAIRIIGSSTDDVTEKVGNVIAAAGREAGSVARVEFALSGARVLQP